MKSYIIQEVEFKPESIKPIWTDELEKEKIKEASEKMLKTIKKKNYTKWVYNEIIYTI